MNNLGNLNTIFSTDTHKFFPRTSDGQKEGGEGRLGPSLTDNYATTKFDVGCSSFDSIFIDMPLFGSLMHYRITHGRLDAVRLISGSLVMLPLRSSVSHY